MNTGSPAAPTEEAVRAYLRKFLMDPHVIDLPFPLRYAIVHGAILPKRPAQSAKAYRKIWTEKGSPNVIHSQHLANALNAELGMLYGTPSPHQAIENLLNNGAKEILLLPLFPQHANATTGACIAEAKKWIKGRVPLRVAPPFHTHSAFISPIAESLKNIENHILFSYHGLPLRQLKKQSTPNYQEQCLATTAAIAKAAGLPKKQYTTSFQSRLGRARWMEPYTEQLLKQLPANGIKQLTIVCPGFFCDGLETLEEIGMRGKETFLKAGGESFHCIPCLNDSRAAKKCLTALA